VVVAAVLPGLADAAAVAVVAAVDVGDSAVANALITVFAGVAEALPTVGDAWATIEPVMSAMARTPVVAAARRTRRATW
jgi:hypothetical protein